METDIKAIIAQFNKERQKDKKATQKSSMNSLMKPSEKELTEVRKKASKFLLDFSPDRQITICNNRELCFFGNFPTLATISKEFGSGIATAWLVPQLANLSEFCGCKDKITPEQIKECATLISQNYYYLKVSELMLFFNRFKQGKYGRFYGVVDPLVIMTALQEFLRERGDEIFDQESEINRQRNLEEKSKGISYEEYLQLKTQPKFNQTI